MIKLEPRPIVDGFRFLEAPKWRDGNLWVSDVFDLKVVAMTDDGRTRILEIGVPHRPAGLGFLNTDDLVIVSQADQKLLCWDGKELSVYADLSSHATGYLNDFAVDPKGRIYVGDFGYDAIAGEASRPTALYRVDNDRSVSRVAEGLEFPNGSVIIDGGRLLIVAETWVGRVTAYDLSADGKLSNRRLFANLAPRQPDGLCADSEGGIWVGCYNTGEFLRVLDGGEITHRIALEGSAISCTLGGLDKRRLFLTAFLGTEKDMAEGKRASAIYAVDVEIPGA